MFDLSSWIERNLEQRKWTQQDLARKIGISPQTLGSILRREMTPGHLVTDALEEAFDVQPRGLLWGHSQMDKIEGKGALAIFQDDPSQLTHHGIFINKFRGRMSPMQRLAAELVGQEDWKGLIQLGLNQVRMRDPAFERRARGQKIRHMRNKHGPKG